MTVHGETDSLQDRDAWKRSLHARSISLVYAAPYLGNPASMFGHTFLKVGRGGSPLLDLGISFDARPESVDAALLYAFKGLTGGYRGAFSQQPYYEKIDAYSHMEDRDLWEFELALDESQIDVLLNTLWEARDQVHDYYFINKNCSYQLLALLDSAVPAWRLRDHFHLMTIPLDTIKAVANNADPNKSMVRSVHFRPSLFRTTEERINTLSNDDRDQFKKFIRDPESFSGTASIAVLDALLDWNKRFPHTVNKDVETRLYLARAMATGTSQPAQTAVPSSPLLAHGSSKISLGFKNENKTGGFVFTFRPVLHDSMDADTGYIPYSTLTFMQTSLVYRKQGGFALDRIDLVDVINLSPLDTIRRKPSWILNANLSSPGDIDCRTCLAAQLGAGAGASASYFDDHFLIYSLGKMHVEYGEVFRSQLGEAYRFGPSAEAGFIFSSLEHYKFRLSAEEFVYSSFANITTRSTASMKIEATLAVSLLPFEVRFGAENWMTADATMLNTKVALGYYF